MRHIFVLLALSIGVAFASDSSPGDKGVPDDSCWKDDNGNRVKVDVRGTMHGDQKITMESGDDTGTTKGTPASDGGCRESGEVTVDGETYDIKNGKVRRKDDDGKFRPMRPAKDNECADEEPDEVGNNGPDTIGSLPDKKPGEVSQLDPGFVPIPPRKSYLVG